MKRHYLLIFLLLAAGLSACTKDIPETLRQEARLLGYTNVYAPILDVGRDQRWGRYEEIPS